MQQAEAGKHSGKPLGRQNRKVKVCVFDAYQRKAYRQKRRIYDNTQEELINREMNMRAERRNNVIVSGLITRGKTFNELKAELENFFKTYLCVYTQIRNVKRERTRLVITFKSLEDKIKVLKNKRKLLDYGMCIYIYTDQTEREKMIQTQVINKANVARLQGNDVKVGHLRLYINGQKWIWDERNNKLVEVLIKYHRYKYS